MNLFVKRMIVIMIPVIFIGMGCYYDKAELLYPGLAADCNSVAGKFTDVQPIIDINCATAGCHDNRTRAGNTVLETYDQIKAKADRIYRRTIVERTMPVGKTLSTQEIAALTCWLNSGTPNN